MVELQRHCAPAPAIGARLSCFAHALDPKIGAMVHFAQPPTETDVERFTGQRRAWNARAFSASLAVIGVLTSVLLLALNLDGSLGPAVLPVLVSSLVQVVAWGFARRGRVTLGALLMITSSLAQHAVVAILSPNAALVTPFFASIFLLIAATCLTRWWLVPVTALSLVAIFSQLMVARAHGLPEELLRGSYISALVLLGVTTTVAFLHISGLEKALALARSREDERKQLFIELEKSARMEALGRLAGGIAHDFNNLLVVIQGSADLAKSRVDEQPEVIEELDQIEEAAGRASALTQQLLAFSRKQVVPSTRLEPQQLLQELEPLLIRLLGRRMTLTLKLEAAGAHVLASATQLEQVLLNLAANARDACAGNGALVISVRRRHLTEGAVADLPPGNYLEIRVTDNGTGIPAEVMDHLFEPFFTTKEVGRGTGLGLATSFGIVHQMGGILTARNEPERGATFSAYLPLTRDEAAPTSPRRRNAPTPLHRALVVDDDDNVRILVRKLLANEGVDVLEAEDARAAESAARQHSDLDLIVTDMVLTGRTGLSTLKDLRALHPSARIIVISSFSPDRSLLGHLNELSVDFLPKPFSKDALLKMAHGASHVARK